MLAIGTKRRKRRARLFDRLNQADGFVEGQSEVCLIYENVDDVVIFNDARGTIDGDEIFKHRWGSKALRLNCEAGLPTAH